MKAFNTLITHNNTMTNYVKQELKFLQPDPFIVSLNETARLFAFFNYNKILANKFQSIRYLFLKKLENKEFFFNKNS